MSHKDEIVFIPNERIISRILFIRGKKVMLDKDLAELYEVETKSLNRAVKRNIDRFPTDFMFQLTHKELSALRYQFGTIETTGRGKHRKYIPYVFTEQGVTMLSAVLKSKRAIQVSIQVVRTFIQLRELLATHTKLRIKIQNMEQKYDKKLKQVFDILKQLLMQETRAKSKTPIGFRKE